MCTRIARRPRRAMRRGLDSRRRAVTENATEGLWREGDHWALRYRGCEARLTACQGTGLSRCLARAPGRRDPRARAPGRSKGRAGAAAPRSPVREPSCGLTTRPVPARPWTRRPRRRIGRASTSCARSSSRPVTGLTTSARRGPRRSSTSSPASWPARSVSAARTGPPHRRPSARARTSGARCTRPCGRSPRRFPSSARISSARSTRAQRARTGPIPSRPSRVCPRRPRSRRRRWRSCSPTSRTRARHPGAVRRLEALIARCPHEGRGEEGSSFVVFARVSDALACALEVQRASRGAFASRCTPERPTGGREPLRRDPRARPRRPGPRVRGRARAGGRGPPPGGEPARSRGAPAA